MINPELERLARARYVSLTTFRRDGTPVATPVWVVSEGGYLQVLSRVTTGKVKRLRRDPRVTIAPCDARGNLQGDPVEGTATIIEDPDLVERARDLVRRRYGLVARAIGLVNRLRGADRDVALAIEVPSAPQDA